MKKKVYANGACLLSGACVAAIAMAQPAVAQEGPPLAVAEAEDRSDANVIVVTATKREEDAQDVPIAITALGTAEIASAGITSTDDLRVAVPALNVTRGAGGFALPRIRGVGATGQGNGIENPVAVYIDGVYYAATTGILQSLFDAEQVAVLKGPQGTLFGRNATGGLLQISTMGPYLGETRVKGQVGYGNYDTISGAAFVNVPLSANMAFSFSGQYEDRNEGFGTNVFTGNDVQAGSQFAGRGKFLFDSLEGTSVMLSADVNGSDYSNPAFAPFGLNSIGEDVPAAIEAAGGDPRYDIRADLDPDMHGRQWGASLTLEQELGGMTLRSISAYRRTRMNLLFDPDGLIIPQLRILNNNIDKTFTQEVNLLSDESGPFKWVVGGFYMWNDAGQDPGRTTGLFTFGDNGYTDDFNNVKLESWSGFVEGTYAIGLATNITAGIRYTHDTRTLDAYQVAFNGNTDTTVTTNYPQESRTFEKVSWKLSVDHRFSDELMMYASYNRGFRAGTFVPQADPITILEPEVLDAYEIGMKTDLFDRRLRFNVAGYYYDQSSVQVMQVIAGIQNVYSARGGAEIYGLDADFSVEATDNLTFFGGVSWNHSRYKDFTDAVVSIPFPLSTSLGPDAATFSTTDYTYVDSQSGETLANTQCLGTFVPPFASGTQAGRDSWYRTRPGGNCLLYGDATGNRLQNTPDWTASFGGNLDIPVSFGLFSLAGNLYYNDGFVGSPDERVEQGDFTVVNASLTWRNPSEDWFVRLWGNNLTNAFYRTQIGASNSADNGTAGAPRTYGVTVGFDF